jgi:hypothetical protein
MRLTEATEELLEKLARAWLRAGKRMADEDRPIEVLAHILHETDSTWYQLPGYEAWLYVRDIRQGHMASLHALNLDGKRALDRDLIRRELLLIMRDFDLRRLNVLIPAPVVDVKAILYWLGFEAEGRIRDACVFEGEFTDSEVFGILRRELEHDLIQEVAPPPQKEKKRRRRSRRNRKKKWASKARIASPQDQSISALPGEVIKPRPNSITQSAS